MQSLPQLIPAGELFTVPVPAPALVTVSVKGPPPEVVNVAVTDRAWVIDTTHEPEPVHAPDQAENVEPLAGAAVKVTDAPAVYAWEQSEPQLMPAGELVTVPAPVPALATVKVNVVGLVPEPNQFGLVSLFGPEVI